MLFKYLRGILKYKIPAHTVGDALMDTLIWILSMMTACLATYAAGYLHGQVSKASPTVSWLLRRNGPR